MAEPADEDLGRELGEESEEVGDAAFVEEDVADREEEEDAAFVEGEVVVLVDLENAE